MSLHARSGIGADRSVPSCLNKNRPLHTKVLSKALQHKYSRRKHGTSQGVTCFGGKILSNIFRRDTTDGLEELDLPDGMDNAANTEGDTVILHEAISSSSGETTQIIFQRNADISTPDLLELIEKVGWPKRSISKLETALQGSYLVSTVVRRDRSADETVLRERLIGLIRCTSDRVFNATIWDVLVDPSYQGKGIGRYMVVKTVESLKAEQIGNICLFADTAVVGFYEQLGFRADPDGVRGMFWSRR